MHIRFLAAAAMLSLSGCIAYPVPVSYSINLPVDPAPPVLTAAGYVGTTCEAGNYVCRVPPGPLGTECSCPGLGAPSFGVVR